MRLLRLLGLSCLLCGPLWAQDSSNPEEPFAAGTRLFAAQDYPGALVQFLGVRKSGIDTPELKFNLGSTYYRLARYPEARAEFEQLASIPDTAPVATYNLGLISWRTGDTDRAATLFTRLIQNSSTDQGLRTLATRALESLEQGPAETVAASTAPEVEAAGEPSSSAAQSATAPAASMFAEGILLFRAQNFEQALIRFRAAADSGLDTPELRFNLGSTYYKLGRYPEAQTEFMALTSTPEAAALAHYNLGLTALRLNDMKAAVAHFEETSKNATDEKLRNLATRALAGLNQDPAQQAALIAAQGSVAKGVSAFGEQRFDAALEHFLSARAAGVKGGELDYNLGTTYYKLARYPEAKTEFEKLLGTPSAALAEYNLGFTEVQLGDRTSALAHFEQAALATKNPDLRALAESAVSQLKQAALAATPKRLQASITAGGGYDDNVTFSPDSEVFGGSDSEDAFVETSGTAQYQIHGDRENGERLFVAGYVRRNIDIDQFNQSVAQGGFTVDRRLGNWLTSATLSGDTIFLDDERFTSGGTGTLEARHALPLNAYIGLRYQGGYVTGADDFDSLDGQRHAGRVSLGKRWTRSELLFSYEYETNNRRDLTTENDEFVSRSPDEHVLSLGGATRIGQRLTLIPSVEYRFAGYDDEERRLQAIEAPGGGLIAVAGDAGKRRDERLLASLRARLALTRKIYMESQYEYLDNQSNFDEFEYDRNSVRLSVGADL